MKVQWDTLIEGVLTGLLGGAGAAIGLIWKSKAPARDLRAVREDLNREVKLLKDAHGLLDARITAVQSEAAESDNQVRAGVAHELDLRLDPLKEKLDEMKRSLDRLVERATWGRE